MAFIDLAYDNFHILKSKIFIIGIALSWSTIGISQTTYEYFSQEGLSYSWLVGSIYDGYWYNGLTYLSSSVDSSGNASLHYASNHSSVNQIFDIEDDKIYLRNRFSDEKSLLYDFGVQVEDLINEGYYKDHRVDSIGAFILSNGEVRKAIYLTNEGNGFGHKRTYVQGLGDINYGFIPFVHFEGGNIFLCATSQGELVYGEPFITTTDIFFQNDYFTCEEASCLNPRPDFEVHQEGLTIQLDNNSQFSEEYLWEFGDGTIATEATPTHTYQKPGCYTITLRAKNNCNQFGNIKRLETNFCEESSWKEVYKRNDLEFQNYFILNDSIDFIWTSESLFKVKNNGMEWVELSVQTMASDSFRVSHLEMWDEYRGLAFVWIPNSNTNIIIVTDDGGFTWSRIESFDPAMVTNLSKLNLAENGIGYFSFGGYDFGLFKTFDYGSSWQSLEPNEISNSTFRQWISSFNYINDNTLYASVTAEISSEIKYFLATTQDGGSTWSYKNLGFGRSELFFLDGEVGYAAHQNDKTLFKTTNGGISWSELDAPRTNSVYFYAEDKGLFTNAFGSILYSNGDLNNPEFTACSNVGINNIRITSDSTAIALNGDKNAKLLLNFNAERLNCYGPIDQDNDGYTEIEDCDDTHALLYSSAQQPQLIKTQESLFPLESQEDIEEVINVWLSNQANAEYIHCDEITWTHNFDQDYSPGNHWVKFTGQVNLSQVEFYALLSIMHDSDGDGITNAEDCDSSNPLIYSSDQPPTLVNEATPLFPLESQTDLSDVIEEWLDNIAYAKYEHCTVIEWSHNYDYDYNPGNHWVKFEGEVTGQSPTVFYALLSILRDSDGDGFSNSNDCDNNNPLLYSQDQLPVLISTHTNLFPLETQDDLGVVIEDWISDLAGAEYIHCDAITWSHNYDYDYSPGNHWVRFTASVNGAIALEFYALLSILHDSGLENPVTTMQDQKVGTTPSTGKETKDAIASIHTLNGVNFRVFPNPTSSTLTIDVEEIEQLEVDLYDATGNVLSIPVNDNILQLSDLEAGSYFLRIADTQTKEVLVKKIIKL